jgi:hypothetical protein
MAKDTGWRGTVSSLMFQRRFPALVCGCGETFVSPSRRDVARLPMLTVDWSDREGDSLSQRPTLNL